MMASVSDADIGMLCGFVFFFLFFVCFFFNDTATTEIYTLSLHDALPISSSIDVLAIGMNDSRLTEYARKSSLIINCSAMGMKNGSAEQLSPLGSTAIQKGALVCDMVYNPTMTPLLDEAKKSGASTVGGLPMLIYQGEIGRAHV